MCQSTVYSSFITGTYIPAAMATLLDRLARLEQVFLDKAISGEGLVPRLRRLEEMCLGSEASGTAPQRIRELELITFGDAAEAGPQEPSLHSQRAGYGGEQILSGGACSNCGNSV